MAEAAALDLFTLARNMIEHEDELINERVTWFLVFQGLLFTAFVESLKLLAETKTKEWPRPLLIGGVLVLQCVGIFSPVVLSQAVRGAEDQIALIRKWATPQKFPDFPAVTGDAGWTVGCFHVSGSLAVLGFAAVWILLSLFFLRGVYLGNRHGGEK